MRPRGRTGTRTAGLAAGVAASLALACPMLGGPGSRLARAETGVPADLRADPGAWPLSAVGKLNVVTGPASRQHCTATLIGPRLALTAAHCLYIRARKSWVAPEDVHFVAGYALGRYTAHAVASSYAKPDAYSYGTAPGDLARDWALVRLAADIPLKPVPVSRMAGQGMAGQGMTGPGTAFTGLVHAGYRRGSDQVVSVERGCTARLVSGPAPLLGNSCVIAPGESGSALILTGADGPAIVGVLVATTDAGKAEAGRLGAGKRETGKADTGTARAGRSAPASLAVPASAFLSAAEAALADRR